MIRSFIKLAPFAQRATSSTTSCFSILDTKVFCQSIRLISASTKSPIEGFDIEKKESILWLKFNRPKKLNAMSHDITKRIITELTEANKDDSIKAVVLTGEGNFYSSGIDLMSFMSAVQHPEGKEVGLKEPRDILVDFVDSFINLEKLLIAAVNGPAIGLAVTTLALCDYVIASDKATFSSPFTSLGMCPEACSSYTFPAIMGASRANELLLLNRSLDAKKAQTYGLVSDVVESDKFPTAINDLLYGKKGGIVSSCYPKSLKVGKSLIRTPELRKKLSDINKIEAEALYQCWLGEEFQDAIVKFMSRGNK